MPVGGLAIRRLLGISGLAECIGRRYELDRAVVVPLPHPSGASSWLNSPANRELTTRGRGARPRRNSLAYRDNARR